CLLFGLPSSSRLQFHAIRPLRPKRSTKLEAPSVRGKMNFVGISTGSKPRLTEVGARSGFGFYGLGWLRHVGRLNAPKKPDKYYPMPPQRRLPRFLTGRAAHRNATKQSEGNLWAERISAHTVLGGPVLCLDRSSKCLMK